MMDKIFEEIRTERAYQDTRWGVTDDDTKNTPWMFASYIAQYATRWMAGEFAPIKRTSTDLFRVSMIKVAAIAVAAVQSIDRQREAGGTFYEEPKA